MAQRAGHKQGTEVRRLTYLHRQTFTGRKDRYHDPSDLRVPRTSHLKTSKEGGAIQISQKLHHTDLCSTNLQGVPCYPHSKVAWPRLHDPTKDRGPCYLSLLAVNI